MTTHFKAFAIKWFDRMIKESIKFSCLKNDDGDIFPRKVIFLLAASLHFALSKVDVLED